ncbi:hypothetical protein [Kitasatospora sp. McL0602]|uniref:hypothetical protein n=1 Tax=Kitasatospora sp. McL0602 TaxID=3439530 RepID=UPI003F8C3CCA
MNTPQRPERASRRLLFRVDVKKYGPRVLSEHLGVQEVLSGLIDRAAGEAGLDRSGWEEQVGGDSVLAFVPEQDEAELRLVDGFVRALMAGLAEHNGQAPEGVRCRVRMAVHHGLAEPGPLGHGGPAPVLVSRLVDSPQLSRALDGSPDAGLALALSRQVFQDTVLQRRTSLRPADFREVRVALPAKDFEEPAWLWVPGGDVHRLDLDDPPAPPAAPAAPAEPAGPAAPGPAEPAGAQVVNHFHGSVDARRANFGVSQGRR